MFPAYKFPIKKFWYLAHYSGIRTIWLKINPPKESVFLDKNYRKPATFPLWILGIYVALFGVASQVYENRVDIIENRANAIFAQLATPIYKKALGKIKRIQSMECPVKPEILNPYTVWLSFSSDTVYTEIVEHLKETIETWKGLLALVNLSGTDLSGLDLSQADLRGAKLDSADLRGTNLNGANLIGATLYGADLKKVDLRGAYLRFGNIEVNDPFIDDFEAAGFKIDAYFGLELSETKFNGADLSRADLRDIDLRDNKYLKGIIFKSAELDSADFRSADLTEACLDSANLRGANLNGTIFVGASFCGTNLTGADLGNTDLRDSKNLKIDQISKVKNLYRAKLDSILLKQVKENYPHLLEMP